ncbi:MAG TPA: HAMP domain-containing sensor histidine kinase [Anaeromyxobacter sp.]|nr:HAMP domain-containing sensor histidine kinase [Anaeromyxobacter sp.]
MDAAAVISLLVGLLGVAVGGLALRLSRAPGWRELQWFGAVALLAAGHAILATWGALAGGESAAALVAARGRFGLSLLVIWAWMRYAEACCRTRAGRWARALELLLLAAAAVAQLPGLALGGLPGRAGLGGGGVTPAGFGLLLPCVPAAAVVLARFRDARRQGLHAAGVLAAGFLVPMALLPAEAGVRALGLDLPVPYELGFLASVALVTWASTLRFLEAIRDLEGLRLRLESLVVERTRALADTQEALVRAERLASLGQLANGVAHQVSNPASVVTANLRFLAENLAADPDSGEVVEDALAAMRRINQLVRRLADAGRIAAAPRPTAAVDLAQVVERAVAETRPRLPAHVALDAQVAPGLRVQARPEVLEQVLHSLLANAVEAVPAGRAGRIEVRAERRPGGVRLTITDDGVGMRPEVLEHAFEPFFTTKPAGQGNGLGLPISRGIVEVHGGALWLESAPERGTTAVLLLPETAAA